MNATLAELRTMVEKERVAEEQEKLRKIQVSHSAYTRSTEAWRCMKLSIANGILLL
jgi:hypothetical protein